MADNGYLPTVVGLSGGLSHERDVSLRSGRRVSQALRSRGYEVVESDVDASLLSRLAELSGSVVFPVLHGEAGEDGSLREVFDLLGVPFVGSIGSACRVAFDKSIATTVVGAAGIRTPTQVALPYETFRELGAQVLVRALGDQVGFRGTFNHKSLLGVFTVYALCMVLPFARGRWRRPLIVLCVALIMGTRSATVTVIRSIEARVSARSTKETKTGSLATSKT